MVSPFQWLEPYDYERLRPWVPTDLPPLPEAASDSAAAQVPVVESGDSLIEVPSDIDRYHAYLSFGSPEIPPKMLIRESVLKRLYQAQELLPKQFSLLLLDTWRTMDAQREIARIYSKTFPNIPARYVADADDPNLIAPHTMGAVADLTLKFDGKGLPMGADFDQFDEQAHLTYFEHLEDPTDDQLLSRDLRRLLGHVMLEAGFAPIASEWWHWSYGDQRWALFYAKDSTLFDTVTP